jgi:hypothetical protein
MTPSPNDRKPRRRRPKRGKPATDLWRDVPAPAAPDAITPAADPTALLRSLGDPPLTGQSVMAGRYMAAVVQRAAGLATALAAAGGLLAEETSDRGRDDHRAV